MCAEEIWSSKNKNQEKLYTLRRAMPKWKLFSRKISKCRKNENIFLFTTYIRQRHHQPERTSPPKKARVRWTLNCCVLKNFECKKISLHNDLKRGKKSYFGRTMHSLPQRLKSTFFEIFLSGESPSTLCTIFTILLTWHFEIMNRKMGY